MADYSNFTDIDIRYSSEFKELYYLALFCLQYNESLILMIEAFKAGRNSFNYPPFLGLASSPYVTSTVSQSVSPSVTKSSHTSHH